MHKKVNFTLDDLSTMSESSRLFQAIKEELKKRGHWKNRARYIPPRDHFMKTKVLAAAKANKTGNITTSRVAEEAFSDGL